LPHPEARQQVGRLLQVINIDLKGNDMQFPNVLKTITSSLILLTIFHVMPLIAHCEARHKKVVVLARVIGVEVPEQPWPMEFQSLKVFYLKIERVLEGNVDEKFIRVEYGYNPSSQPENILPEEMFDGRSVWEFQLERWDTFDAKVEVSRKEGDWIDEQNSRQEGNERIIPIKPKCVPTNGHQKDAMLLERMKKVKGYWLGWKSFNKPQS
jgi:hypothetical protein